MDLSAWVTGLTDAELERLRAALEARRLAVPMSPALLRAYELPEAWAAPLGHLAEKQWPVGVLAGLVAVAVSERAKARARRVDVVCTRPSAGKVAVVDTSVAVRRLFQQARREVLIAGFRVHEREMLEPLRRRDGQALDVRLFVDIDPGLTATGGKQPMPADLELWPGLWWQQFLAGVWPLYLDPPRAYYAPSTLGTHESGEWRSMHVKSIVVDRKVWFVTSANFTKRGHERNLEMGALIEDPDRADEVASAFEEWIGAGVFRLVVPLPSRLGG